MSIPKVSSDFISSVLNSYYAKKVNPNDSKSEKTEASSKYEATSTKYNEKDYKAYSSMDDEDYPSRSEKTMSSKYDDSDMYDDYSSSNDYKASSSKDYRASSNKYDDDDDDDDEDEAGSSRYEESDSRRYDAYSSNKDHRSSSKGYTKSKPPGKYDDYKDGSCTMEEDAYYDEMYPTYDAYAEYPGYPHGDYPQPHGVPPMAPFPPMGYPRPPMPRGPHHPYPRGPLRHPPPFNEKDGPRHGPPVRPYDRVDHVDEGAGPPDNRYNDNRPPKRRYNDDDRHHRYPKKFASEKSAKELFDFDKLPKVLTDMFTSATCNLCLVTLHQPGLMELHYRGKNHNKRMKGWLYKFSGEQHSLSASEIEQIDAFDMKPNDIPGVELAALSDDILNAEGNDITYCKLCNIPISSAVVAKQHYSGKKHMKALNDSKQGGGAEQVVKQPVDSLPKSNDKPKPNVVFNSKFYCHVCKVSSVSEEQYETHLVGKRHKKAWKATHVLAPVGLQNVSQSKHRPIYYDIDPELLEDYELSLYCIRCQEYFTISAEFTYHSCPESELLCKKCQTRFDSKPEHKYHDCPLDHYCDKCEECFDSLNAVAIHKCGGAKEKNTHPGMAGLDGSYQCTLCRKTMNSVLSLDMHGKSRLHCALLHKLTEYYPDLPPDFNPIKTLPKMVYHCDKCDVNFKDGEELDAHMKQGNHSIRIGVAAKLGNFPPSSDGQGAVAGGYPRKEGSSNLDNFPEVLDEKAENGAAHGGAGGSLMRGTNEVGTYDIRNIDVNELLKGYKK